MQNNINVIDSKVVVKLHGSLYVDEAAILRDKLMAYVQEGYTDFIMDMTNVDYIDSSGLGVLVAIHKRVLQEGGKVAIQGVQGTVKDLFELTRLTKVFAIVN